MANKGLFASAVAKLLSRADTVNHEGAPAYAYGPDAKLAQLAATSAASSPRARPNIHRERRFAAPDWYRHARADVRSRRDATYPSH